MFRGLLLSLAYYIIQYTLFCLEGKVRKVEEEKKQVFCCHHHYRLLASFFQVERFFRKNLRKNLLVSISQETKEGGDAAHLNIVNNYRYVHDERTKTGFNDILSDHLCG